MAFYHQAGGPCSPGGCGATLAQVRRAGRVPRGRAAGPAGACLSGMLRLARAQGAPPQPGSSPPPPPRRLQPLTRTG